MYEKKSFTKRKCFRYTKKNGSNLHSDDKKNNKKKKISFINQIGKPSYFKRRKKKDSEINFKNISTIKKLYNFFRMLDAPDYPKAYIHLNKYKFSFNDVKMYKDKINAKVEIIKNEKK